MVGAARWRRLPRPQARASAQRGEGPDRSHHRHERTRAEGELGPKFNVRTFHDALLTEGPLPLALLDQRMDAWIAEQKAK